MKKALKIVFDVVAWVILIFALLVTILVFTADKNNGVSNLFGYVPMTVESDSMKPTFKKNDMIIAKEVDDVKSLKKGDVISFWMIEESSGTKIKNTHRIVSVNIIGNTASFVTKGDNNSINDKKTVGSADVIGKWTGTKISGFGKVMDFLRTKTGFFVCILIPMILFFLFELYKLIVTIVEIKRPKLSEDDEEEIKKRAVAEYLAEQQENNAEETVEKAETTSEVDEKNSK